MTTAAKDRLAQLLGGQAQAAASSMELKAPLSDLRVDVAGIGELQFPVTATQAKKLIKLSAPASFGKGEATIIDTSVRDTWEVSKDLVHVEWDEAALAGVLGDIREGLGLPWQCEIGIEFHSMLVYEKGQFFAAHQDSEKDDAMIGTLVVTLPSACTGGILLIDDKEPLAYAGSKTDHTLVAFYADLRHEVLPVKAGYRVTVTYNLLLRGDTSGHGAGNDATVAELAHRLTEYFTTLMPGYYGGPAGDPPTRLAYLLDHEYTPRGLSWSRLKGADASRCDLLRAAAAKANCEAVLALADVKETHSAYEADAYYERGRYGHYRDWDDEDDEDDDGSGEYVIEELVDSEVTVTHWLSPEGKRAEDASLHIWSPEVCASTASGALKPYQSSYEGYMGNYGNTLDRWYKRGAVLIWPHVQAFANRAEVSPAWALDELEAQARSGDTAGARAAAGTLHRFWDNAARPQEPALLPKALRTAGALGDDAAAMALLRPFHVETLGAEHAAALGELAASHGAQWTQELLTTWSGDLKSWDYARGRRDWTLVLPELCPALAATGQHGALVAHQLLGMTWEWLRGQITGEFKSPSPSRREQALDGLGQPLAAVLRAAAWLEAVPLAEEITDFVRLQPHEVIPLLLAALRAASGFPDAARRDGHFAELAKGGAARLRVLLGRPPRAAGDWSIQLPASCGCDQCVTLTRFLADPARQAFEWPLRTEDRRHIHSRIDAAELPVTHVTRRTGRPYTLVLKKTEALFDADGAARAKEMTSLAWLTAEWMPANS